MSVRGSHSLRLHAGSGAARGQPEADYSLDLVPGAEDGRWECAIRHACRFKLANDGHDMSLAAALPQAGTRISSTLVDFSMRRWAAP